MKKKARKRNPPCELCPLHYMVGAGWCSICVGKDPSKWPVFSVKRRGMPTEFITAEKASKSALYRRHRAILEGVEG